MTRLEFFARHLAVRRLGLVGDPTRAKFPEYVWQQALADAEFVLAMIQEFELQEIVKRFHVEVEE